PSGDRWTRTTRPPGRVVHFRAPFSGTAATPRQRRRPCPGGPDAREPVLARARLRPGRPARRERPEGGPLASAEPRDPARSPPALVGRPPAPPRRRRTDHAGSGPPRSDPRRTDFRDPGRARQVGLRGRRARGLAEAPHASGPSGGDVPARPGERRKEV